MLLHWLDPLHGEGYQFWSGIGGYLAIVAVFWRHVNCHQPGCHRIGRYHHPDGLFCRRHHPRWRNQ